MEIYVVHAQKAMAIISSGHFGLYKNHFSFAFWWWGVGGGWKFMLFEQPF